MRRKTIVGIAAIWILSAGKALPAAAVPLRLAAIFGDHMVLQRGVPLRIWGTGPSGASVMVSLAGKSAVARAGLDGKWSAELEALEAGGPFVLTVAAGETLTLKDVMVGEVWLASGQSNMEFALKDEKHAAEELPKAADTRIRFFVMEKTLALKPLDDVKGAWTVCEPSAAGGFSAVAYYFARRIARDVNVPVGVIQNAWGGSAAESWVPMNSLENDPVLKPINDRWRGLPAPERAGMVDGWDYGVEFASFRFVSRETGIEPVAVSLTGWSASVKPDSTGFAASENGEKSLLFKGNMKTGAWGSFAVEFRPPRDLSAFDALEFQVRGRGKYSIGFIQPSITDWNYHSSAAMDAAKAWTDARVPLSSVKQGGWGQAKPFTQNELSGIRVNIIVPSMPDGPGLMYNALIAPIAKYRVRGALWYQGETNAGRAVQYRKLLPALIENWRETFGEPGMPFYIVQLASYKQRRDAPEESAWAELREAQARASAMPGTALATALDLGEADDIHPKEKREVGERLFRWASHDLYGGRDVEVSGPLFKSMEVEGKMASLSFDHAAKGLKAGNGPLTGFAVAGPDKVFHWAEAKISKDRVLVACPEVAAPAAVRYGWADNPDCNLYNSEGLPAVPFRTDDWPVSSENAR